MNPKDLFSAYLRMSPAELRALLIRAGISAVKSIPIFGEPLSILLEPVGKASESAAAHPEAQLKQPEVVSSQIICAGTFNPFTFEVIGLGISGITDSGVGDYAIHFSSPVEEQYLIMVSADRMLVAHTDQTPRGFRISVLSPSDGMPGDGLVKFMCVSLEPRSIVAAPHRSPPSIQ